MKIKGKDGVDHINVYSKGKTLLGRKLSNFAHTPFMYPGEGSFDSVEGWWYYRITGFKGFKGLSGSTAKMLGKELCKYLSPDIIDSCTPDKESLKTAYKSKLNAHPEIVEMLTDSTLPFTHYYMIGGKKMVPEEWVWTGELWEELREDYGN